MTGTTRAVRGRLLTFQDDPAQVGPEASYRYLVESIRRFPDQPAFAALMQGAGLEQVRWRNLSGGIAAIHSGWRL